MRISIDILVILWYNKTIINNKEEFTMTQPLPKILPVNELKNTASIMKTCKDSHVPIVITRNGYGEAVMMSVELYEEMFAKMQAASLINAGLDEIDGGAKSAEGKEFFASMRTKYGK